MAVMQTPTSNYQYPIAGGTGPIFNAPVAGQATSPQAPTPNIGGLINTGKQILSAGNGTMLPSGVAQTVDKFGKSILGVGTTTPIQGPVMPGAMGPAPLGVGTQGGLSTNFSAANAGAGLAGGLLANKVFGGGTGTTVGSTIGGLAGSFLGPVGAGLGSFIGGGIGSMFGNSKPSNRLQVSGINMATGQRDLAGEKNFSQGGKKFSEQNAALRDQFAGATSDMVQFLYQNGAQPTEDIGNLVLRFGDRSGYDFFFEKPGATQQELMNMTDEQRGIQSYGRDTNALAQGLSQNVLSKFNVDPALAEQAKARFMGSLNPQGQSQQGAPIPMVAPPKTFKEFMQEKGNK